MLSLSQTWISLIISSPSIQFLHPSKMLWRGGNCMGTGLSLPLPTTHPFEATCLLKHCLYCPLKYFINFSFSVNQRYITFLSPLMTILWNSIYDSQLPAANCLLLTVNCLYCLYGVNSSFHFVNTLSLYVKSTLLDTKMSWLFV